MLKRVLISLLTAVLLAAGLVGVSPVLTSPASAACPYTGCVQTSVNSEAKRFIRKGQSVRIKVGVRSAGNVYPVGTVRMVVNRRGGGVVRTATSGIRRAERYVSRTTFTLRGLRKGRYTIQFSYRPARNSTFVPSGNSRPLRVKPARRPR